MTDSLHDSVVAIMTAEREALESFQEHAVIFADHLRQINERLDALGGLPSNARQFIGAVLSDLNFKINGPLVSMITERTSNGQL